jgi:S-adenosyl-L-methionine hydrolase (adenosine-forming)
MGPARPIAFLTDFGPDDFYAGVMRAVAISSSPLSRLIDLSHGIPAHGVAQASFVLARSIDYLPLDAVVVVVVDPGVGGERRGILVEVGERVLVGPDNGFASDLFAGRPTGSVFAIDDAAAARAAGFPARGATFHGRDVFAPVAAAIARGAPAGDFGPAVEGAVMLRDVPSVSIDAGRVRGTGRYVDRFGNVLSDIPRVVLERVFGDRLEAAGVAVGARQAGALRRAYVEGAPGELMCLLNSWGLVEAAVNGGRAWDLLGARRPEDVRFELRGP